MSRPTLWPGLGLGSRDGRNAGGRVGVLYEYCERIQQHIQGNGLDVFRTRGELALKAGFLITIVEPNDPDDPQLIQSLRQAALDVLGLRLD